MVQFPLYSSQLLPVLTSSLPISTLIYVYSFDIFPLTWISRYFHLAIHIPGFCSLLQYRDNTQFKRRDSCLQKERQVMCCGFSTLQSVYLKKRLQSDVDKYFSVISQISDISNSLPRTNYSKALGSKTKLHTSTVSNKFSFTFHL